MKRVLISLLLFLLLAVGSTRLSPPQTHEQQVREYINHTFATAVALMYAEEDGNKNFVCTATAFDREKGGYLFLTASHCVVMTGGGPFYLSPDTSNPEQYYPAEVVAYGDLNQDLDYAVLYIKAPTGTFTLASLGHNPKQAGESILSVSAPAGVGKAVIRGTISVLALPHDEVMSSHGFHDNWRGDILFNMPGGTGGSSGSSILCEDQMKVCAVYVGHVNGGSVAQPIEKFKDWWNGIQEGSINPRPSVPKDDEDDFLKALIKSLGSIKK